MNKNQKINGLVLAGGKSTRMGEDKGAITYHGVTQRSYLVSLLKKWIANVYISCRADQEAIFSKEAPVITDKLTGLGPFGAIVSAFQFESNTAWLVIACDLPLVDDTLIQELIEKRDPGKIATAFQSPSNEFPEPLITIWEPKSYPILMEFFEQGYSCPRKVLIKGDIQLIHSHQSKKLLNVNFPEERDAVFKSLKK